MATPEGYSTVCPYLLVKDVHAQIQFLAQVFGGEVRQKLKTPDGEIMHAEVKIGSAVIMIGVGEKENPSLQSMNYVYVKDCIKTYERALKHGGEIILEPTDQFFGNREAGVQDPLGNQWWITQVVEQLSPEEIQERLNEISAED